MTGATVLYHFEGGVGKAEGALIAPLAELGEAEVVEGAGIAILFRSDGGAEGAMREAADSTNRQSGQQSE